MNDFFYLANRNAEVGRCSKPRLFLMELYRHAIFPTKLFQQLMTVMQLFE